MKLLPPKKDMADAIISVLSKADKPMKASDIDSAVADILKIPEEVLQIEDANCGGTEFAYQMRWIRTDLKKRGIIKNPSRGYWK